jgi:hypothetical protein
MATRVVVEQSCDICGSIDDANDVLVESVHITVGKVEYEIDLCGPCLSGTRVLEMARRVKGERKSRAKGEVVESSPDEPVDMRCGFTGCDYVGPRLQSLNAHRTKAQHWTPKTRKAQ